MKTTTTYYDKLNESGERLYTSFRLVKDDGTEHEISDRVRDHSDIDEEVEDETLNVGRGDLALLLDNRDRFFVADHEGGGLFDDMPWGRWQLFVVRGFQKSTDELGSYRGIVSPAYERQDNGYRVKITVLSFSSYAKRISAWDGTDAGRSRFNAPIAALTDEMLSRLDPNGIPPGDPGSVLDSDIVLPTLAGSRRFYQSFDSTLEPEGRNVQGMVDGPRKLYYMKTVGDEAVFWLDTKAGVNSVSWTMAYNLTTGVWRKVGLEYWGSYGAGTDREPLFEGLAQDSGDSKRYWFVYSDEIRAWTTGAGLGNPAGATIRYDHGFLHTARPPMCFTTASDGTSLFYVEWWEGLGNVYHFRAQAISLATGARTELVRLGMASDVNLITNGYRYLGVDGSALLCHGALVHPNGDQVLVFTGNSVFSHKIGAATTVRVGPLPGHPGTNRGWLIKDFRDDDRPRQFFTEYHMVRDGDWWGMVGWRRGDFDTGYSAYTARGVMVDNYGDHPTYGEWIDNREWGAGFSPADGIGLLPEDHPDNDGADQTIRLFDQQAIDVHMGGGLGATTTYFSTLFRDPQFGLGNRCYQVQAPPSFPHLPGDKPFFRQNYWTVVLTTDFDFARGGRGNVGERLDGLFSLPSEFYAQSVAQGPGGTPIDDNRRITFLIRQSTTIPVVHKADLHDANAWTVITRALQAANSSGVFRWNEATGRLVFYVRGRTRVDSFQQISEEYDFELAESERLWEHVYDGISIKAALGQLGEAGDVTSPNTRVLTIDNDYISPSLVEALAADYLAFFSKNRRVFKLTLRDRPHWEMLDHLPVYLLNDRGNYTGRIMGRQVALDRDRLDLFLVETSP